MPEHTKIIVSYHDFEETPDDETLHNLVEAMFNCGGDIAKIAATATDISDSMRMLDLLEDPRGELADTTGILLAGNHFLPQVLHCSANRPLDVAGARLRAVVGG